MPTAPTLWLRALGALALFAVAAAHLYEYSADHYSVIPTIGTLFLLNGIGAIAIGLALLLPLYRVMPERYATATLLALAAAGAGLAVSTLVGLLVAESRPLFGFMEVGYRPVVVVAIVAEVLAIVLLSALFVILARQLAEARRVGERVMAG